MKRDVFFLSDKLMEETEELCLQREQKAVSFQFMIQYMSSYAVFSYIML